MSTQRRLDFFAQNAAAYNSREPEILLAGPAGSGKSFVLLAKCLTLLGKYPCCRGLFCRGTRASLTQTGLVTWEEKILGKKHPVLTRRPVTRRVRQSYEFANGSEFVIAGLDDPGKTLSSEYDFVYVQEATEEGVTLDTYETLLRALRNGRTPFTQLMSDCNPSTPAHFLYRRQQDRADGNRGPLRMFSSTRKDNPAYYDRDGTPTEAGKRYEENLSRTSGRRLKRFQLGVWAAAEGLVYEQYSPDVHLMPAGWRCPVEWPRVWSIDWGFDVPSVLQVWAVDPDRRMYLVREVYLTRQRGSDMGKHARKMIDQDGEPYPIAAVCDHDEEKRSTFEAEAKIPLTFADKTERDLGLDQVSDRLDLSNDLRPRMFFARDSMRHPPDERLVDAGKPTCTTDEIVGYIWEKSNELKPKDEPIPYNDHGCFVAGTMVTTADGDKPIESIRPGDMVLTRGGFFPVLEAGMTADSAQVMTVLFDNGAELTGTPNHPVWVEGIGFRRMDEMRYGDSVLTATEGDEWRSSNWNRRNESCGCGSTASCTAATHRRNGHRTGTTSGPVLVTCERAADTFTGMSGSRPTDLSRTATRLTTPAETASTTHSPTCNCSPWPSTRKSTGKNSQSGRGAGFWPGPRSKSPACKLLRPSGTDLRKAGNGTGDTLLACLPASLSSVSGVSGVALNMRSRSTGEITPCTARTSARPQPAGLPVSMTKTACASAGPCSASTSTRKQSPASRLAFVESPARSARSAEPCSSPRRPSAGGFARSRVLTLKAHGRGRAVFNLTVDVCPEYFANGVLVHNCDAMRYATRYVGSHMLDRGTDGGYGAPEPEEYNGW